MNSFANSIGVWIDARLQNFVAGAAFNQAVKTAVAEAIVDADVALKADVSQGVAGVESTVANITQSFANIPGEIIQGVLSGLHLPFLGDPNRSPGFPPGSPPYRIT